MRSERIDEADIAVVGSLVGDPARARVLLALADGRAPRASLLAVEAGVAPSTVSHQLAKLVDAGLITVVQRRRYRRRRGDARRSQAASLVRSSADCSTCSTCAGSSPTRRPACCG